MAKSAVSDWDTSAAANTDVGGVGIQGSNQVSSGDNALREIMAQIATFITAATFTGTTPVTLLSTDAGTGLGPILVIDRDSATPAANDFIGQIIFRGEDSAGNDENYADIYSQIIDPTSTSEDASLFLRTKIAGTITAILTLSSAGLTVGTGLILPQASAPAPTAEGDMRWDTDDDVLVVGNGSSAVTFAPIASQAAMEAGSSNVLTVTPGRQHFHPSAAKAWANFGVSGNVTASFNITSVTDNGTGDATVNIATDFSSANWAGSVTTQSTAGSIRWVYFYGKAAGTANIASYNTSSALADPTGYDFIAFGDQA